MMQLYADGSLAYDSRLRESGKDYSLTALKTSVGINKGGTLELTMPPGHPAYNDFIGFRTIVELYREGELQFRGRVLNISDDFHNFRTVLCEGEMCLLQDAVSRPYLHETSPEEIFRYLIADYNSQVEAFKQFSVGEITVTDPNNYIRLESETPESILDTINKLITRCGGYVVFSYDDAGQRLIHWYKSLGRQNTQLIEFGSNLLSFSRSSIASGLVTGIIPYGAKDESTGVRVGIKDVNNGLDYIVDEEAVAIRGTILKPVIWEDVTLPENLLVKAKAYLQENRLVVTSLTLSAIDLSHMDKSIESFRLGDMIHVRSKPHAVNEYFQLVERTENYLDPAQSSITLGKEQKSLTEADVAGDKESTSDLYRIAQSIINHTRGIDAKLTETEERLTSKMERDSTQIRLEVARQSSDMETMKSQQAAVALSSNAASISIQNIIQNGVDQVTTKTNYTFNEKGLRIQKSGEQMENNLDNTGMVVSRSGTVMLSATADGVQATDVKVNNYLIVGDHCRFEDYSNGKDSRRTACFFTG